VARVKDGSNDVVQETSDEFGFYYIAAIETGRRSRSSAVRSVERSWSGRRRNLIALSSTDKVELSARARDFLHSSIRRDRSRRKRAITVLSVLLVLAIAGAAIAVVQQQVAQGQKRLAQQQLRIATARQLITEASTSLEDDPLEALQLGVAAVRIQDDAETRASLVTSLITTPYAGTLTGHDDLVGGLAFRPNGNIMVSCGEDDSCRVWRFKAPNLPTPLGPPFSEHADVYALAFNPDGTILACALANGTVHLWSLADADRPTGFGPPIKAQNNAHVRGVAFGKGGTMVAVGEDGLVRAWDVNNRIIRSCTAHPSKASKARCVRLRSAQMGGSLRPVGSTPRYDCGDSTGIIPSRLVHPSKVTGQEWCAPSHSVGTEAA
jgi:WD40 repeat protein